MKPKKETAPVIKIPKATVHLDHGTGKREVFTLPIVWETTSGFTLAIGDDTKGGTSNLRTEWFPKNSAKCTTFRV